MLPKQPVLPPHASCTHSPIVEGIVGVRTCLPSGEPSTLHVAQVVPNALQLSHRGLRVTQNSQPRVQDASLPVRQTHQPHWGTRDGESALPRSQPLISHPILPRRHPGWRKPNSNLLQLSLSPPDPKQISFLSLRDPNFVFLTGERISRSSTISMVGSEYGVS